MQIQPVEGYGSSIAQLAGAEDPKAIRAKILALQASMTDMPQVECPVEHFFAPGLYARQIFMPKGAVVVGKIHNHAHVNTISKGSCEVMTEFGPMTITAPHTFVSQPGTKRVVVVLEDTVWTTYHPTDETELEKIEEHVIAKSYNALPHADVPKLKGSL